MSGERQTDTTPSVDQRTRAEQTEEPQEEQVQTTDEAVEVLRRQVLELEARDRAREAELAAEGKRLAEERSRREAAEARATSVARDAENRVAHAEDIGRRTVDDARLGEITTSLTAHQGHMEALKTQYTAAFGEGDAAKMAEIQANMARMGARIETLEQAKSQIEARKTQQPPPPQPIQPQAPGIDREALMRGLTSVERDWVLAHPRYFEDESFRNEVTAAAAYALNRKHLSRESTEYINFLNEDLGLVQRQEPSPPPPPSTNGSGRSVEGGAGASATSTADRRMVAAPVGGSVPNVSRAAQDNEPPVYLTKEEKAQAARDGFSEAEIAKHKRDLIREGLIGPNARNR